MTHPRLHSPIPHRLASLLILIALAAPGLARAQASVSAEDSAFAYTLTVDQLVYSRIDSVFASYVIENITDSVRTLPLCCCGVNFFAVRDSTCRIGEPGCGIAGCDGCAVCFPLLGCEMDPCIPIPMAPGEIREFTWDWDTEICEGDFGWDPIFGNIGTFRITAGYEECETTKLVRVLEIPITILTAVPVTPSRWGTIKERYGRDRP